MKLSGVFWYGLVVVVLSFLAGLQGGSVVDGVFAAAVNGLVFVLPVVVIRNVRRSRRERGTAT